MKREKTMNHSNHLQQLNPDRNIPINDNNGQIGPTSMTISEQFKKYWLTAIIGLILFAAGMSLLFWNEGKSVKIAYSLKEALNNVVIPSDINHISSEHEGKLIYLSGPLTISEPLTEPEYGIIIASVKLKRRVQMYQWVEVEIGEFSYSYDKEWSDKLIDSDRFDIPYSHRNPKVMPIKSQVQIASDVKIGSYSLGSELKAKFVDYQEITSDERPDNADIKMHSGLYYHSADLWEPEIGDIRIQFSYAGKSNDIYTIVGKLTDGTITPFFSSNGNEILLNKRHKIPVDQIFHLAHVSNYWRTWKLRLLGWMMLFLAAVCLANIIKTIILNSSVLCGIISVESVELSVSMSISLLIISFAWVWYHPFIGLCLAIASIIPFVCSTVASNPPAQPRDQYRRL